MDLTRLHVVKLIYKLILFLYTNSKQLANEIEKVNLQEWQIYLEINLTKDMRDLYTENYRIFLREIKT